MESFKNYFIFILTLNLLIIPFNICSFKSLKKISDDGDYFVILDNGLYIYNFEKSECESIMTIGNSIFNQNDENNYIIITKNINSNLNETKIAALINQYLYVCKYDISINNCEYQSIQSLKDTYPFYVHIDNFKLKIYSLIYKYKILVGKYLIESFDFANYSTIKKEDTQINECNEDYTNRPVCQFDNFNSLIKCVYNYYFGDYLKYQAINTEFSVIDEISLKEESGYESITFALSENIDFFCALKKNIIGCFYKKKSEGEFTKITHNFQNGCSNLQTYYFDENNEFVLFCKNSNNYYLYIFDAGNMLNNIKQQDIILSNYNKKISIIYSNKTKKYDIIYDGNFTKSCKYFNEESELTIDMTNKNSEDSNEEEEEIAIDITDKYKEEKEEADKYIDIIIKKENSEDNIYKELINRLSELIENNPQKNEGDKYKLEDIIEATKTFTPKTWEQIINNLDELIEDKKIGNDYEIEGEDFKITINPTNSTALENSTYIDFGECEQILREKNNISNSSIITFVQIEKYNNNPNALYNQIQYYAYNDQKQLLDLSVCEDVETQIHYKLKDNVNLDFAKIKEFKEKGVDIFNINDKFFNDICNPYSESNNDMILSDRVNYIYQNYTLCEEGCTFNNFDSDSKMITCNCKIRSNFTNITIPLVYDTSNVSFFDSNIAIARCYKLVFSFAGKINNIGFIIFTILLLVYIIFFITFLRKRTKSISGFVFDEMMKYGYLNPKNNNNDSESKKIKAKSTILGKNMKKENKPNPNKKARTKRKYKTNSKKNNQSKSNIQMNLITGEEENYNNINALKEKDKKNWILNNLNHKNDEIKSKRKLMNKKVIDNFGIIKINLNKNIKKYYPKDSDQTLFNYTFDEAIRYDRRNIFRIFYIYLLNKQIIFHTFFLRSPLELFVLRFMLFIFMLSCDLALNSLFYLNDNISKKYHYGKNLFLFAFSNNLTIIIYSTLISYVLITLLTKLTHSSNAIRNIFRKEEKNLKSKKNYNITEKRKKEIYQEVLNVFKRLKIKLIFLFIIEIILILFFWYFVTAFCEVYTKTQTSWLLDGFLSILSRFFIELIAAFLYAKLYQVSIASNMETLYKIVMCSYDFS